MALRVFSSSRFMIFGLMFVFILPIVFAFNKDIAALESQARLGDVTAQLSLGIAYEHGNGVQQNYGEAAKWYLKSADQGNADAQFFISTFYKAGKGVPCDEETSFKWLIKAAENGQVNALALCVKDFRKKAMKGSMPATYLLGKFLYRQGKGVPTDFKEAADCFRKAGDAGNSVSAMTLGIMYMHGHGVEKNLEASNQLIKQLANQGFLPAQVALGRLYNQGLKKEKILVDYTESAKWYLMAAKQGKIEAQMALAGYYYKGLGVTKDLVSAYAWSYIAASNDSNAAIESAAFRTGLTLLLTPVQIQKAKDFAKSLAANIKE